MTRICTVKTYRPVAGDDHLLVKIDEASFVSDTVEEKQDDDTKIEAYARGQRKAGNMVFIFYDND